MFYDLSCDIPLTDADISGRHNLVGDQLGLRVAAALHESAHLVAAAACRKTCISALTIGSPTLKDGGKGFFDSLELWPDHTSFVTLVGYAWEEAYGDIKYAWSDYERGFNPHHPEILDDARAFVSANSDLILRVAKTVLRVIPKHGRFEGFLLALLVKELRENFVKPYVSGYVTGKLDHAVEY